MNPTDKNKKKLTHLEKNQLISQISHYRRLLRRQLHTHQELLMLHMDLIPILINEPAYQSYVERWMTLTKELQHGKTIQREN